MVLDLLMPTGGQRRLIASGFGRWTIHVGWRGHGAVPCIWSFKRQNDTGGNDNKM
jgi:hypothetical protein